MGRIILFLLISAFSFAQVSTMTIQGDTYTFVDGSFSELRAPRTGTTVQEQYPEIVSTDLNTYLMAFVKDAILGGKDLDLAHHGQTSDNLLRTPWFLELPNYRDLLRPRYDDTNYLVFANRPAGVAGSSFNSVDVGYRIEIDPTLWNSLNPGIVLVNFGHTLFERRLRLMFHELGHALLHYDHRCVARRQWISIRPSSGSRQLGYYVAIMGTAECGYLSDFERTDSDLGTFSVSRDEFFTDFRILNRSPRSSSSKGRGLEHVIND